MKKIKHYLAFIFFFTLCWIFSSCQYPLLLPLGGSQGSNLERDLINTQCQKDYQRDCLLFKETGAMAKDGDTLYVGVEGLIHKIHLPTGKREDFAKLDFKWKLIENLSKGFVVFEDFLYVSQGPEGRILKFNLKTKQSSIFLSGKDFQPPLQESFYPVTLTIFGKNLFFVEGTFGQIHQFNFEKNTTEIIAGNRVEGFKDGIGQEAQFIKMYDLGIEKNNLWVTDYVSLRNNALRRINLSTREVKTIIPRYSRFPDGTIYAMAGDGNFIYLGTRYKIFRLDSKRKRAIHLAGSRFRARGQIRNGSKESANFFTPNLLMIHDNYLFISHKASSSKYIIRMLNLETLKVTTL